MLNGFSNIGHGLGVAIVLYAGFAKADPPHMTINEVLAACESSEARIKHEKCDRLFGSFFLGIGMSETAMSPTPSKLCFPLRKYDDTLKAFHDYQSAVLDWLRAHPALGSLSEDDGVGRATMALYACDATKRENAR